MKNATLCFGVAFSYLYEILVCSALTGKCGGVSMTRVYFKVLVEGEESVKGGSHFRHAASITSPFCQMAQCFSIIIISFFFHGIIII